MITGNLQQPDWPRPRAAAGRWVPRRSGGRAVLAARACGVVFASLLAAFSAGAASAPSGSTPRRVIAMAPNLTEIVFALGAGDRLVAVSEYSDYPPEARDLPRLGGFVNPDVERILAQKPDLVIVRDYSRPLEEKMRAFGVPVLRVRDEGIADILQTIREIGTALGAGGQGRKLAAEVEAEVDSYRRRPAPRHRPRVLLVAGRAPGTLQDLHAPGRGTFLDEMIQLAGGSNLFGDSAIAYPKVSKEEVISRDPEVILEPVSALSYSGVRPDPADWRALGPLSAVRHGRIHILEGDYLLIPGPRIALALRDLERAIRGAGAVPHPEVSVPAQRDPAARDPNRGIPSP